MEGRGLLPSAGALAGRDACPCRWTGTTGSSGAWSAAWSSSRTDVGRRGGLAGVGQTVGRLRRSRRRATIIVSSIGAEGLPGEPARAASGARSTPRPAGSAGRACSSEPTMASEEFEDRAPPVGWAVDAGRGVSRVGMGSTRTATLIAQHCHAGSTTCRRTHSSVEPVPFWISARRRRGSVGGLDPPDANFVHSNGQRTKSENHAHRERIPGGRGRGGFAGGGYLLLVM